MFACFNFVVNAKDNRDKDIHGQAFNGNTEIHTKSHGYGHASDNGDNGDNHASDNGNEHGVGHNHDPVVPIPGAVWMMVAGLAGLLGISRRK